MKLNTGKYTWSQSEDDYMRKNYADKPSIEVANALKRSLRAVYSRAKILGITKSDQFLKSDASGMFKKGKANHVRTQFKKGHTPFNKGKKIDEYLTPNQVKKFKQTSFKKNNLPHNTKHDGAISIRHDSKSKRPYKHIRISLSKWELLHRVVWEKENGKIPAGMLVSFKDGNTLNCDIENLKLITTAENMKNNSIHQYPEEYKEVFKVKSKITRKINKLTNGTKQN